MNYIFTFIHMIGMNGCGYVCGVLCGTGYVIMGRNHAIGLETSDKVFAELFAVKLGACLGKQPNIRVKQREKPAHVVTLYGKDQIKAFVGKWSLMTESNALSIPKVAYNDREFRIGLLRGFFDAKASIITKQRNVFLPVWDRYISVVSTDKSLLEAVQKLLAVEDIDNSLFRHGNRLWSIRIGGRTRMSAFQEKVGFELARKKARLVDALTSLAAA